ncbi:MAG: bifunctional (p)ppGpp synthetase/guanosine-3',5'-bis(diphosphate) 3'-pyrophosphohydrolase [Candidatus Marinimicrobia bacterium]|jgi:GTP pyrophosphokinase|nr:bifunctional (p)ppGpp synthetase/guanosine-3',5'-bis(diphosphate) 3'-pyrophosphohydrolase [Candidatus Neomarinimicrobiota bacterium]MDP6852596.1 bifunctional (p)ppGpp synthetase/guanosine-3',5'-bis(diphosphate) 3'-pyrophosphohydrolase [Candidatus Neomarinimicrobiota bacterium]MDP6935999.1 bifunctional (p)ppGpp synthetase/guanosine-3',5'-bis(diphosphate) 3'-pyrophosphohydrolase [Candidatus Neomarinimicrobiota bacterium]
MLLDKLKNILPGDGGEFPPDFQSIIHNLNYEREKDQDHINFIWNVYQFSANAHEGQQRRSGEPYFTHCSSVGVILSEWKMDAKTISAGLLHDVIEDTEVTRGKMVEKFGEEITDLVDGVSKLSGIKFSSRLEKQAENFMKMFLSVAKDLRVIIIKFADRLHNMSTIEHLPLIKQRRIAIETRDVYAPLAHRLGMNKLKIELEDLVLKTLEPNEYKQLQKKVRASRRQREKYIEEFSKPIRYELNSFNITAEILGRAKHYYSIFGKMRRRHKKFEELFDLFAIRIVVDKIEECYAVLGVIHQLYTPLQERFKDYIATPKSNGYQSIHTTVFGHKGKMVEVQIRTKEMDRTAEIGVAAHWVYKEQGSVNAEGKDIDRHMRWLRELVDVLQGEDTNPDEFLKLLKVDLFKDEIFVFTPKGDVTQLPANSTPIDFAFQVHSQVGIHCIGAKVNGKIVPLNTVLNNGDSIEIITSNTQKPSYAWLKFVQTGKAKSHIKRWVKKEQTEQSIRLGKEILEKTLRRMKRIAILTELQTKPQLLGFNSEDMVYSALANGQLTVRDIIEKFEPVVEEPEADPEEQSLTERFIRRARRQAKGVTVDGVHNALLAFAKCCSPIPGDHIVGYITRGRGVTIHRNSCKNIPFMEGEDRFIYVEWDVRSGSSFIVRLKISLEDRKQLLKDITENISALNINITSIDMKAAEGIATAIIILEVRDTRQLERLTTRIQKIPNFISIERM